MTGWPVGIHEVAPVDELMSRIVGEAEEALHTAASFTGQSTR
jgi:hypothetical protein